MLVKGTRTEYNVMIEIDDEKIVKYLYGMFDLSSDYYVKDGGIYTQEEYGFHTSRYEEKFVSNDKDKIEIISAIKVIQKHLKQIKK